MCTVMPRVHVAMTGIEKVLPTLEDVATADAAAAALRRPGRPSSNYFSLTTGPRAEGERDGPEHITSCWSTAAAPG